MQSKKLKLVLWATLLTMALFGCKANSDTQEPSVPSETKSTVSKVDNPLYREDAIQYVPEESHTKYEDGHDTFFLDNVFLISCENDADLSGLELPDELLGAHLKGFDLFTKCYLYECDSTYPVATLVNFCDQATIQLSESTGVPVYCHPYDFYDFAVDPAITTDENIAKFSDFLNSEPAYRYGVYIPNPLDVETASDGTSYIKGMIQATIGTTNADYSELLETTGGTISGCMRGAEEQYPNYRKCGGDFVIIMDSAKSFDELNAVCDELEMSMVNVPEEYDENGQILTPQKSLFVHEPKPLDYDAYLYFYDYNTVPPISTYLR